MSSSTPEDRNRDLIKVIAAMTEDLDHASWKLVFHHYKYLKHLPLSTLDYWRVIGRNQDACLTAVLKFPSDVYELMSRMRDELGVMWEFTSRASLLRAYEAFFEALLKQLGSDVQQAMVSQIVDDVFSKMGSLSDSLASQIDIILFQKSGKRSERFDRMAADHHRCPSTMLSQLWQGEDSHLQRFLLRNHADEKLWPYFKLWEELLNEISNQCDPVYVDFVFNLGHELLWVPQLPLGNPATNTKLDVANAPLLTGFLVQACDANKWLQSGDHMAALRQIKAFDPIWFEMSFQTGSLLAMKASDRPSTARRVKKLSIQPSERAASPQSNN